MNEVRNDWKEFWIQVDDKVIPSNRKHYVSDAEQIEELVSCNPGESVDDYKKKHLHAIEYEAYETVQISFKLKTATCLLKQARIEELESQNRMLNMKMMNEHSASLRVEKLESANKIMLEALEFYGDIKRWSESKEGINDRINFDGDENFEDEFSCEQLTISGKKAREAINKADKILGE